MIYLDNSATSPIDPRVAEAMAPYLAAYYGNPSSKYYQAALDAKVAVEQARAQVAALIGATPEETCFTSGATESINHIIKGVLDYQKHYGKGGCKVITSSVEHKAVMNTCLYLNGDIYSNDDPTAFFKNKKKAERGYKAVFLNVNGYGQVKGVALENAIDAETELVSIIWANNEIGSINDIKALCGITHRHGKLFHTDATQAVGKIPVDVKVAGIDFLSFSGHKLYAPKGIGVSYIRSDGYGMMPISALLHGGEQESGFRAGTLAVHDIVGIGQAAEIAKAEMDAYTKKLLGFEAEIRAALTRDYVFFLGDPASRIPGLVSFVVRKEMFNNEQFLKRVAPKLAMSTGSACTAGKPSHVLDAIGRGIDKSFVLRISLGKFITAEEVAKVAAILKEEI